MSDSFNNLYAICRYAAPKIPIRSVWVHRDGRVIGLTGESEYRLSSIPPGFVKDDCPLDAEVDIYIPAGNRP